MGRRALTVVAVSAAVFVVAIAPCVQAAPLPSQASVAEDGTGVSHVGQVPKAEIAVEITTGLTPEQAATLAALDPEAATASYGKDGVITTNLIQGAVLAGAVIAIVAAIGP